ncbi:mannosyltransferase family protein [Curtobacterium sp. Leaf261]|uniref:mannosyltransferase family protein n=1 Tax=Curtobacterium sp. Leaf261 TaxID=1736311 RepID=UPI0006FE1B16|nr:mannosyltransferase family protein [Curtobacterium sp. Leaf261]KQO62157.1 hypothetical protein ASF23_10005 [Curtobacterium sp. Leaf261]
MSAPLADHPSVEPARLVLGRLVRGRLAAGRRVPGPHASNLADRLRPWLVAAVGSIALWAVSRALVMTIAALSLQLDRGSLLGGRPRSALLAHWDSAHFTTIAERGYFPAAIADPGLPAFFPGYPMLVRALATVIGPGDVVAAIPLALEIVAAVGAVVAGTILWRSAAGTAVAADAGRAARRRSPGDQAGLAATTLLFLGPYALFLHASYSESTFLAFAVGAWHAARTRHWLTAGLLCAGAGLVRANGMFLLAALVVVYVLSRRRDGLRVLAPGLPAVLVGACGTVAYFVYLWAETGRVDAWSHAQTVGWGRALSAPLAALRESVSLVHVHPNESARIQFVFDIGFAALLVLAVTWFVVRRAWPEAVYLGLTALSLVTSVSFVSLARNTLTLFPIVVAVGRGAERSMAGRVLWTAMLAVGLALLTFNTHQFALGLWAD